MPLNYICAFCYTSHYWFPACTFQIPLISLQYELVVLLRRMKFKVGNRCDVSWESYFTDGHKLVSAQRHVADI